MKRPRCSPDRVLILGTGVDRVSPAEAAERVVQLARKGARGCTRLVVTANPEILMTARRDDTLREVLDEAALVVADGIGVVAAARLLGAPVPSRVAGIELAEALLERCAARGLRPFLLGARPEVIERAAARVGARWPGLKLAGWHHGYFSCDDPAPVREVARSGADLLLAGMGADRELRWLYAHRGRLNVAVALGVGGSFDVLSGRVRRAPAWMRGAHLEWLYRLMREPARWRRQLALPQFAVLVLGTALARSLGRGSGGRGSSGR